VERFLEIVEGQSETAEFLSEFIRFPSAQGTPVKGSASHGNRLRSSGFKGFDGTFGDLTGSDNQQPTG
tara:strand:- start:517 stop:720 length:204 start_codon:yes stop_codon:yes gene_type:complete